MSRLRRALTAAVTLTLLLVVAPPPGPGRRGPLPARVAVVALTGSTVAAPQDVDLPLAATHVAVRWSGDEAAAPQVRIDGRWRRVEIAHDLDDPVRGIHHSGLLPAGGARRVEVRLAPGVRSAAVVAVDAAPRVRRSRRPVESVASAAPVPGDTVVPRTAWGADERARRGSPRHARAERIVVHHTVTANDDGDPAATVRAIAAYHVHARGWEDVGYHFLVDGSGRVYEGRRARAYGDGESPTGEDTAGRPVVGAHVADHNRGSVGIALLGTFTDRAPTPAALEAVERLVAWELDRHDLPASAVVGHRDLGTTACPGGRLHELLPDIRRRAAARVAAARAHAPPAVGYRTLGRDGTVDGFGLPADPLAPLVAPFLRPGAAVASTRTGAGYWVASATGRVVGFGDAVVYGSAEAVAAPGDPVVALEPTPTGRGYWVVTRRGTVAAFGDAPAVVPRGVLDGPVAAAAAAPDGRGLWLATAAGHVAVAGDARPHGSPVRPLPAAVTGLAAAGDAGYWVLTADGTVTGVGVLGLGGPAALGARGPFTAVEATPSGRGYWVLGADGGVFTFGDAPFRGARSGRAGDAEAVALSGA